MNVKEKNDGQKINYAVNGSKIVLDDTISVNLAKFQKDNDNEIDVCLDEDMELTTGLGRWYVANIIIPAKEYKLVDAGTKDKDGNEMFNKVAQPLNMDEVTLVLWALPYNYISGGAQ